MEGITGKLQDSINFLVDQMIDLSNKFETIKKA